MVQLPPPLANSAFFTKAQKDQLAAVDQLPVTDPSFYDERLKNIFQYYSLTPDEMDAELQRYASVLLTGNKVYDAWQVLLSTTFM